MSAPVPEQAAPTGAAAARWQSLLPAEALDAVRLGLTSIVAIYLAMMFELQTPSWAGWTVLSVSLATRASSLQKSRWRAVGSILGAAVAISLVALFAQSTLAFDVALALWLALAAAASSMEHSQRSYGFALVGFTVPIIALNNFNQPDLVFQLALDRCSTLLLGIGCAHVSSVLVAPSARVASRSLATQMEAAVSACIRWSDVPDDTPDRLPPLRTVLALDSAISDAFTEQSSLRTGGRVVAEAPIRLLRFLAVEMLRRRLGPRSADPAALLGENFGTPARQLRRVGAAARLLRSGRRVGRSFAPLRPLDIDRDGRGALKTGTRTAVAISLANAFWYVSEWPDGASAVTWTALLSALFAARLDAALAARNFLVGGALAAVVAVVLHYTVLTTSGSFPLLAAVLLPVCMLAALGRSDKRVTIGAGYGMLVLTLLAPENVMRYQLGAALNEVVADLLGMWIAVIAFTALPPPASPETRRWRVKLRMSHDLRAVASRPAWLLPPEDRWLGQNADRLAQLAPEALASIEFAETSLLAGLLVLAIRCDDDRLGRAVGGMLCETGSGAAAIAALAGRPGHAPLQCDRLAALVRLLDIKADPGWPGLLAGLAPGAAQ
nr:FUSC family protein [uncultured Lichenicoccus sp.]